MLPLASQHSSQQYAVPENTGIRAVPAHGLAALVGRITEADATALTELHSILFPGIRCLIRHYLGSRDADAIANEAYASVVAGIWAGELREAEHLLGYVRAVVRKRIQGRSGRLSAMAQTSPVTEQAEERAAEDERLAAMRRILADLCSQDREILWRFYVLGQSAEEIAQEMNVTTERVRRVRSRARKAFMNVRGTRQQTIGPAIKVF